MTGTKTVSQAFTVSPCTDLLMCHQILNAMQGWSDESMLTELISQQGISQVHTFTNESNSVSPETRQEHLNILGRIQSVLQRLQPYLATCEQESRWIDQLSGYIQRLINSNPPQSSEEQFTQLYALRKWLFWVPIALLSSRKGDIFTLLVLSHFYAVALSLEPLFSHIGAPFLGSLALPPLEELIKVINTVQSSDSFTSITQAAAMMMEFPREALASYKSRREWNPVQSSSVQVPQHPYGIETLNLDLGAHIAEFGYNNSLSPAFAPSPLQLSPPATLPGTNPRSPFLEVPRSSVREMFGYSSAGSNYSTTPLTSTHVPTPTYKPFKQEEDSTFNFNSTPYGYPGGFVAPPATVWT
jgi:hypothetical protein